MRETLKIGLSGVRGIVGESFTPQLAATFAQSFGTFAGGGTILVGRDTRESGRMIEPAVVAGLQAVGCRPALLGVVPTPSLLFAVNAWGARGGIMITASHNREEWNALKFVDRHGWFLDAAHAEELFDLYHQQDFPLVHEADLLAAEHRAAAVEPHFARIAEYVDGAAIRAADLKVVVDCCNGVGALHTVVFLRDWLGCRTVYTVFDTPSGRFERGPEPVPEHLDTLREKVKACGADVGFAQDPDGDRLAAVDHTGEPLGEERTVALALQSVLAQHDIGPIAVNLSATRAFDDLARQFGVPLERARTGEVHVTAAMRRTGAVAGGEHTGGIIVPAVHCGRDSYTGMALLLERMALTGRSLRSLDQTLPRYYSAKASLPLRTDQASRIMRRLRQAYDGNRLHQKDGLYVEWPDGWLQVRRSNTEPVLRLIVEGPTPEAATQRLAELKAHVNGTPLAVV